MQPWRADLGEAGIGGCGEAFWAEVIDLGEAIYRPRNIALPLYRKAYVHAITDVTRALLIDTIYDL